MSKLKLKDLHSMISSKDTNTALVMMVDPGSDEHPEDKALVNDIIKNVINKDLLRLIFEKHV